MKLSELEDFKKLDDTVQAWNRAQYENTKLRIHELDKRAEYLSKKMIQIDDLEYEKELIIQDIILKLREEFYYTSGNLFQGLDLPNLYNRASDYIKNKRKYKENKKDFVLMTDYIMKNILNNNKSFKFKEMVNQNFGTHYCFKYDYKGKEFEIQIPNFKNADSRNWTELLQGYRIYTIREVVHECILCSLDYKELNEKFAEYIKSL